MHTHGNTRAWAGLGELCRTSHIFSKEQVWVPLWSGLGLATGWPGSSKLPQTEWVLSVKKVEERGLLVPSQPLREKKKKNPMGLGLVLPT
jgi:hypothetical protein